MINHIMLGTNDIKRARVFYSEVLKVLGAGEPMVHVSDHGNKRLFFIHNGSTFSLSEPINGEPVEASNGFTLGFKCDSLEQVTKLHDVAVANGGTSIEDPPGPRESNMGTMNLCYFRDPDGHKICGINMVG